MVMVMVVPSTTCLSSFLLLSFFLVYFHLPLLSANFTCSQPFHCGNLTNIKFPFYNFLNSKCGAYSIPIKCNDSIPKIWSDKFGELGVVKNISYTEKTLLVHVPDWPSRACDFIYDFDSPNFEFLNFPKGNPNLTFFICKPGQYFAYEKLPKDFYKYTGCRDHDDIFYTHQEETLGLQSLLVGCNAVHLPILLPPSFDYDVLFSISNASFTFQWNIPQDCFKCQEKGGLCIRNYEMENFYCSLDGNQDGSGSKMKLKVGIGIGFLSGLVCFIFLFILLGTAVRVNFDSKAFLRNKTNESHKVEDFLKNYGALSMKRYRYSDIKKMTNNFKVKVGEGGFGGVFKGKLHDSRPVAVKVLNKTKGDGEEFMNEVASIGRTYHVNIVTLLGFCSEGSKRALIYEFMPNGSLEKFIYNSNSSTPNSLGWDKLYQIALGIARGLEYLHRGCNMRILHLDIKPHNILLDENFCPKIADFGLAKLCTTKESITSMIGARGTMGYIAPEVLCRNFGGVSYKSDVYSYGMMVLEMVGGRKNIELGVENTSEIYFPDWAYKHLTLHADLALIQYITEAEQITAKKMIVVGLWCIQTDPANRPSMSRAVEMLEGTLGGLQMPPNPFLFSPQQDSSDPTSEGNFNVT